MDELQTKYRSKRQEVLDLLLSISHALESSPKDAANWSDLCEMQYLRNQLQDISDRLTGAGEYA